MSIFLKKQSKKIIVTIIAIVAILTGMPNMAKAVNATIDALPIYENYGNTSGKILQSDITSGKIKSIRFKVSDDATDIAYRWNMNLSKVDSSKEASTATQWIELPAGTNRTVEIPINIYNNGANMPTGLLELSVAVSTATGTGNWKNIPYYIVNEIDEMDTTVPTIRAKNFKMPEDNEAEPIKVKSGEVNIYNEETNTYDSCFKVEISDVGNNDTEGTDIYWTAAKLSTTNPESVTYSPSELKYTKKELTIGYGNNVDIQLPTEKGMYYVLVTAVDGSNNKTNINWVKFEIKDDITPPELSFKDNETEAEIFYGDTYNEIIVSNEELSSLKVEGTTTNLIDTLKQEDGKYTYTYSQNNITENKEITFVAVDKEGNESKITKTITVKDYIKSINVTKTKTDYKAGDEVRFSDVEIEITMASGEIRNKITPEGEEERNLTLADLTRDELSGVVGIDNLKVGQNTITIQYISKGDILEKEFTVIATKDVDLSDFKVLPEGNIVYNGEAKTASLNKELPEGVSKVEYTYKKVGETTTSTNAPTEIGEYEVTATFTPTNEYYLLGNTTIIGRFTIVQKQVKVILNNDTQITSEYNKDINQTYNFTVKEINADGTEGNNLTQEEIDTLGIIIKAYNTDGTTLLAKGADVGTTYPIKLNASSKIAENYDIVFDTVYYSITKAIYSLDASKLTFSPSSEGLGENKHETAKLTGLPNGVTATYKYVNVKDTSIELDAPAEVGTYNVVATFSFTDDAEGTALKNNYSNINPASYTYQNAFTVDQTAYNLTGISFNDDTSKIFNKNTQGIAIRWRTNKCRNIYSKSKILYNI